MAQRCISSSLMLVTLLAASSSAFFSPSLHHLPFSTSQLSNALISTSESSPRDTSPLFDWSQNYGIQLSDSLELSSSSDTTPTNNNAANDIYATSTQHIPQSTPLLSIPSSLILTGANARNELSEQTYGAEQQSLPLSEHQPFYLFLKIISEYSQGEHSPYYYWLNSLPRYYENGASMTDFCFGCLPPYAAGLALKEKQRLKRYIEVVNGDSMQWGVDEDVLQWAYNVVFTRYVDLPGGDVGLVPMVDYLNHGVEANVDVTYDDEGNCHVYTNREVGMNEPLVISYGDSTNPSSLLARYGFLEESCAATFCKYVVEEPTGEMFDLGYPNSMYFYNDGSISNEVWDVLLYEMLKVSPDEQQQFYQACMSGDEDTKGMFHNQYMQQTFRAVGSHVDYILNELEELGIGLETQIAQGQDKRRHPRLPLIQRHNEFVKVSPTEQQAFHRAHMTGDEATKQYYHEQYFTQTRQVLKSHVDYLMNELDDLSESSWRKTFRKDQNRHPRLPLILRHNNFVREIFALVQQNLDGMSS